MNELKIKLPANVSLDEAQLLLAVKLFETGKLSIGQAAKLAGYSKRTFIELLSNMGVPVINYPAEDLEREISLWVLLMIRKLYLLLPIVPAWLG